MSKPLKLIFSEGTFLLSNIFSTALKFVLIIWLQKINKNEKNENHEFFEKTLSINAIKFNSFQRKL